MDFVTYQNQLEACRLTHGLVPHPAFQPMTSSNGMPLTSPWQVCALGQTAEKTKPAYRPTPVLEDCTRPWAPDEFYSAPVSSTPPALPMAAFPTQNYMAAVPAVYPSTSYYDDDRENLLKRIVDWVIERVFPFTVLQRLGDEFEHASRRLRIGVGIFCAMVVLAVSATQPEMWEPISAHFPVGLGWILAATAGIFGLWKGSPLLSQAVFWLNRALAFLMLAAVVCTVVGLLYLGLILSQQH